MTKLQVPRARRPRRAIFGMVLHGLCVVAASYALAQPSDHGRPQAPQGPSAASQEERWRRRFPQPVLVSDLFGRTILDRDQGVLGWVETVTRGPDGVLQIAFSRRRLLLFRGETVVVPANVTALLGRFVMILDLDFDEIDRLPVFRPGATPVDPASRIAMALTKH